MNTQCIIRSAICRLTLLWLISLPLTGCLQQVRVDGGWADGASHDAVFTRVLVVGLSPDPGARCDFESFMATQIRAVGAEAKASCVLMRTTEPLTRESIEQVVAEYRADAVLTTVLVQADIGSQVGGDRETRGGLDFKAIDTGYAGVYRGGYGYYGVPVVYGEFQEAPVIETVEGEVSILSMLDATADAALMYALNTTASDLSSRDSALAIITEPIANRLQQAGLLR